MQLHVLGHNIDILVQEVCPVDLINQLARVFRVNDDRLLRIAERVDQRETALDNDTTIRQARFLNCLQQRSALAWPDLVRPVQ